MINTVSHTLRVYLADIAVNGVMVYSLFTSLVVSDVTDSDEGSYTCLVQGTDAEASVQLSITENITTIVQEQFTTDVLSGQISQK